jgi:hypothetical protein
MARLSEAELKVLLYVIRRTFGFKKDADAISMLQMEKGITKRDGTVLDTGTGMSKSSVWRGINGLVAKGILIKQTSTAENGDSDINVYSLRFQDEVVSKSNNPHVKMKPPVVSKSNTQDSSKQERENEGLTPELRRLAEHAQHMFEHEP